MEQFNLHISHMFQLYNCVELVTIWLLWTIQPGYIYIQWSLRKGDQSGLGVGGTVVLDIDVQWYNWVELITSFFGGTIQQVEQLGQLIMYYIPKKVLPFAFF